MAARMNPESIHTCEMYSPMADIAEATIRNNNLANQILLHRGSSTDIWRDIQPQPPPNVVISEIVDSELLGEGILPSIRHVVKSLAAPDAIYIPYRAEVIVQLVASEELSRWHNVDGLVIGGVDLPNDLSPHLELLHDVQVDQLSDLTTLTEPVRASNIRLNQDILPEGEHSEASTITATASGQACALIFWWRLYLHEDIVIDTAPGWINPDAFFREHWMPCVFLLPSPMHVMQGDDLNLTAFHDDYRYWFTLTSEREQPLPSLPARSWGLHACMDRYAIRQLWDDGYNQQLELLADHFRHEKELVVQTSSIALVLVLLSREDVTIFLDPISPLLRNALEQLLEPYPLHAARLQDASTAPENTKCLIEPVLSRHSNVLEWLATPAVAYPTCARITMQLVELPDLASIAQPVGLADGFEMSAYDAVAMAQQPMVTEQCLWEYKHTRLTTAPTQMLALPSATELTLQCTAKCVSQGTAHACIIQIDLGNDDNAVGRSGHGALSMLWIGTTTLANSCYKSTLMMLPSPVQLQVDIDVYLQLRIAASKIVHFLLA
eukprot:TRINITY_DN11701_c0_g2_i3.p1 TRINITY_DN11701_c0_g2~~TRINITY_DN11701_c0_g2_i3.p1  ORF type:complete len:625 (+),score=96.48 TRINITY_DN11701_c0_g2_i3:224-1876(+)